MVKHPAYRVTISVLFGMAGFAVNFLNIQLFSSPDFKISILLGLLFPLVIALAWGWKYGLLAALAGGSQTMWWLWQNDGWGILYSVPVFTLWIVWHGWWADRRRKGSSWRKSPFVVEIPFRIAMEFGFYTIFRWLVSLNPPPWNPSITWNSVSLSWVNTVAIKHAIAGYVLLLAAYVILDLGPVLRFFGLRKSASQRDTSTIYAGGVLMGFALWILDSLVGYLTLQTGKTFWEVAVLDVEPHELFMRVLYVIVSIIAAAIIANLVRRRAFLAERLAHLTLVLRAVRNVNQLIVREKDRKRLLQSACDRLIETRGYQSAWIALFDQSGKLEASVQSGLRKEFVPLHEKLERGELPVCVGQAMTQAGVVATVDAAACAGCPLATQYSPGHGALTARLEHAGVVYGVVSASIPADLSNDEGEASLFEEIVGDIAFALHGIELEEARSRSEHALERDEAEIRTTLYSIGDGVISTDVEGRVVRMNQVAERLTGWSEAEAIGEPLDEVFRIKNEETGDVVENPVSKVLREGNVVGLANHTVLISRDGRKIPIADSGAAIKDSAGEITGVVLVFRDQTSARRAQRALLESERLLASTFNSIQDGISVLNPDLTIRYTNGIMREWYAQNLPLEGKKCYECYHNKGIPCAPCPSLRAMKSGRMERDIVPGIEGSPVKWTEVFSYPMKDPDSGEVTGVVEFVRNVTERAQIEQDLRETSERLELAMDAGEHGFWDWNLDTGDIYFSPRYYTMLGYKPGELPMRLETWVNLMHPEDRETIVPQVQRYVKNAEPYSVEFRLKCKDGSWKWISGRGKSYEKDDSGVPHRAVGVHVDITELKRAEEERQALQAQLLQAQKLESIGTLASGVAHEINNPLTGIINYAQLITERVEDDELKKFANGIMKEGNRAAGIVKDLLYFARQEQQSHSPARMEDIIDASLTLVGAALRVDQITIEKEIPKDLPQVRCRSQQIEQVIINLLTNARDALNQRYKGYHEDKLIKLTVRPFEKDGIEWIRTTVEDHGAGIAEDVIDSIFDPFFTTKPRDIGTGLGLSVSYGIVKDHHGKLTVESEPGKYTRFHLDLRVDNGWTVEQTGNAECGTGK